VFAAGTYYIVSNLLRYWLTRDHIRGMAAYRARRFEDAITHFEASRRFFLAHRRLDAIRSLLFGVACRNPYRTIAIGNMAFCYAQLGNSARAIELYEQVLKEQPDHSVAIANLKLLRPNDPAPAIVESETQAPRAAGGAMR
jgi:tetratricopeptide (TPR) repeat protein